MDAIDAQPPGLGAPTKEKPVDADEFGIGEFEELYRRYERSIGSFLAQIVGDRSLADDLVQETFAAALGEREHLNSIRNPEAWLFRIARNCALQALRRRRRAFRAVTRLSLERHTYEADPADAVAVRDHSTRHLKPDERALLVLRYVHGFSSHELAEIARRSPEAIRKELSRTTRKLLQSLNDEPETQEKGIVPWTQ